MSHWQINRLDIPYIWYSAGIELDIRLTWIFGWILHFVKIPGGHSHRDDDYDNEEDGSQHSDLSPPSTECYPLVIHMLSTTWYKRQKHILALVWLPAPLFPGGRLSMALVQCHCTIRWFMFAIWLLQNTYNKQACSLCIGIIKYVLGTRGPGRYQLALVIAPWALCVGSRCSR